MSAVRKPAVAGVFYTADPATLHGEVRAFLRAVPPGGDIPKAIIVPHAGYVYSAPVAASAYARLAPARGRVKRVVLLGPSHRVAFHGLAVPSCESYETPFGRIELDHAAIAGLSALPQVVCLDAAHAHVTAEADARARMKLGAALADDDVAGFNRLPTIDLHSEVLGV